MAISEKWFGFFLSICTRILNACAAQLYTRAHRKRYQERKEEIAARKHLESPKNVDGDSDKDENVNDDDDDDENKEEEEGDDNPQKQKSYVRDSRWLLGLFCAVIGALTDIMSLGYAPASMIAPMGSLTLIFNMCLNPIINGERVSRFTIGATIFICTGTVITIVFSPKGDSDEGHDIGEELENIYFTWYFAAFSIFITVVIGSLWFATIRWKDTVKVYCVAVPALSGTLSALNRTVAKGMAIGLKFTIRGDGCFCVEWLWYVTFVGIFFSLFASLRWLNRGLAQFSAVHIVPISSTFSILVATMGGLIVYNEWTRFKDTTAEILFSFGMLTTISGVIALTKSPESQQSKTRKGSIIDTVYHSNTKSLRLSLRNIVDGNENMEMVASTDGENGDEPVDSVTKSRTVHGEDEEEKIELNVGSQESEQREQST